MSIQTSVTPPGPPGAHDGASTLAYRGNGSHRPDAVVVPTSDAPLMQGGVLRKAWRFAGVWTPEVSLCAASVKAGPFPHEFWAVWLPRTGRLHERSRLAAKHVKTEGDRLEVRDAGVLISIGLERVQHSTMEVVTPVGRAWTWTRKSLVHATGEVIADGRRYDIDTYGMVEDNGGYHPRHTHWRWAAGTGTLIDGRSVMWNIVVGLNDTPPLHENTVWVDGVPRQIGLATISEDLARIEVDGETLHFDCGVERSNVTNLLLLRSRYRAPLGSFHGSLPGGLRLAEGYGVMEDHDAVW